ncbi:MAG: PaaI family thioesterase [Chloroflexota bacterium]
MTFSLDYNTSRFRAKTGASTSTAFWRAVATRFSPGQMAATSEMKVNFLRPARGDFLVVMSRVIHKGSRLIVGDTEVTDAQGSLGDKALGTYVILESRRG